MDSKVLELKLTLKELIQNLLRRITPICESIESEEGKRRLNNWLEDLTVLIETILILTDNGAIDIDLNLFNEKIEQLLDSIEDKDYLLTSDLLQYECKPLLSEWDGCIYYD